MHESALDYHAVKNEAPSVQVEAGKGRPEAVVEASACVCDNVKEFVEWRLILKNAGKRLRFEIAWHEAN
jgi:hypothetical protein